MTDKTASKEIDDIVASYDNWKGKSLADIRAAIRQADPKVVEEIKWRMKTRPEGLAVWTHDGIICFAEIWKDNIKLIFAKGAKMESLQLHFNARLDSKDLRAIEYRENDAVDASVISKLVKEAIRLNGLKSKN